MAGQAPVDWDSPESGCTVISLLVLWIVAHIAGTFRYDAKEPESQMTNYRADYLTVEALSSMPFKALGHDVMIHERGTLVGIENISIGSHVRIDPDVILLAT